MGDFMEGTLGRLLRMVCAGLIASSAAHAAAPVILTDSRVPPYQAAARSIRDQLRQAEEVEISASTADAKLHDAPLVVAVGVEALSMARGKTQAPIVFAMVLGVNKDMLAPNVTGVLTEPDPEVV